MEMGVKGNIFDGVHEEKLYKHIYSQWNKFFNIYPQLPFTKIFDIRSLNINKKERDFLLKTNLDITVCDKKYKPIMCIEFDGMSEGYNKNNQYVQVKKDPLRKRKLELKLKIAAEHNFPFYIISYDEKKYISERIHLGIIDGIIGQTIAKLKFKSFIRELNKYTNKERAKIVFKNEYARQEYLQDIVTSLEVKLELDWDPIAKMASEIESILFQRGIAHRLSYKPLSDPELPELKDIFDFEGMEKILESWKNIKRHGYEVTCETIKGKVSEIAWVRNFENQGVSSINIARNIAELLALYNAAAINGIII